MLKRKQKVDPADAAVGKALQRLLATAGIATVGIAITNKGHVLFYHINKHYPSFEYDPFSLADALNAEAERLEDRKSLRDELNEALS